MPVDSDKGSTKKDRILNAVYRWFWERFKSNEVVIYARKPIYYVMVQEIHKYLPEIKVVASGRLTKAYLRSAHIPYRTWLGFPKIVISSQYLRSTYNIEGIKKITTFHGMAKDVMFNPNNFNFDLLLVMGDYAAERFESLGLKQYKIVGYPKIDKLFNGSLDTESYRKRLQIDSSKPTLLYAPTWGNNSSLPLMINHLPALAVDYNVLVKLHDSSYEKWAEKIKEIADIRFIDDPDIVPYYSLADILISDYSSVIFEFSTLDRPIILIDREQTRYSPNSIGYLWRDIGLRVRNGDELNLAIRRSLAQPEEFSPQRKKYAQYLFKYTDGRSAERAAAAIREFCHEAGVQI
jgi:CDP-glycerol glycerophosphotransferase (TagB/SpsB family)